jgi:hypothetical protein
MTETAQVDHIQPAQNAVDDCPEYRMVGSIGYCYGKGGAEAPRRILRPRRGPRSNDFRSCSRPQLPIQPY